MIFEWEPVAGADEYIINIVRENRWGLRESWFKSDEKGIAIIETEFRTPKSVKAGSNHYWAVAAVKNGEKGEWSDVWSFKTEQGIYRDDNNLSRRRFDTAIEQNYPNPFNPTTQIEFTLAKVQNVSLHVYDMAGRQVAVLVDGIKRAGRHTATFNAEHLASGVYFYRFITDSQEYTKKMTLVK